MNEEKLITEFVARKFTVGMYSVLPQNFDGVIASSRIKAQAISKISDDLTVGISTYLLAGKHEEQSNWLEYSTYPNWWEHFKDECFPAWLKRWFPPQKDDHRELVHYSGPVYVCPHHDIDFRTQKLTHLKWLARTEPMILPKTSEGK